MSVRPVPVHLVGFEVAQNVEHVVSARGDIHDMRPIPGSERAYLEIALAPGVTVRAAVGLPEINRMIEHYHCLQLDAGDRDPEVEAFINELEKVGALLIGYRGRASLHPITRGFDAAVARAKELIGDVNRELEKDAKP